MHGIPVQQGHAQEAAVFIIDDGEGSFGEVARILRVAGFAVYALRSPRFAVDRLARCSSACALLSLHAHGFDAVQVPRALVKLGFPTPVVFLTDRMDVRRSVMAMKAGATDVLLKPVGKDKLLDVMRGAMVQDQASRRVRALHNERHQRLALLTPREREVCDWVCAGLMNKQIDARMGIAEKTVKIHRGQAMRKLAVHCVPEFVRFLDGLHDQRSEVHVAGQPMESWPPLDQPERPVQSIQAREAVSFRAQMGSGDCSAAGPAAPHP